MARGAKRARALVACATGVFALLLGTADAQTQRTVAQAERDRRAESQRAERLREIEQAELVCFDTETTGLDPMRAKGVREHGADGARAAEAVDRAEAHLAAILELAPRLGDREVQSRATALVSEARQMLSMVEQDPRDLDRARRYLSVYLKGAHEATRKYAENHARLNDPKLRSEYLALIGDLEASFGRGRRTLLEDDRTDLEVEIEVLRGRLEQEGA